MSPEQIVIKKAIDHSWEWMEMAQDPTAFLAVVLAGMIVKQNDRIEYLERRLAHVSAN
jgi:hypothetical protein